MLFMNRRRTIRTLVFGGLGAWSALAPTEACRTRREKLTLSSPGTQRLIIQLTEVIIPETDTPGAKSVGADVFVVRALRDCYDLDALDKFLSGLDDFEQECISRYGRPFAACSPQQRLSLFEKVDREVFSMWTKIKFKIFHTPHFFKLLKELTLIGYFSSRQGATQTLSYEPIPGRWVACMEMRPGQKTWATQ
jgi:hypothetical protein